MSRQWKPGDVALVTFDNASPAEKARGESDVVTRLALRGSGWWAMGRASGLDDDQPILDARPLVVINLENSEQLERLARAYVDTWKAPHSDYVPHQEVVRVVARQMEAALHSLLAPEPPDEPMDPAIRAFADGSEWARVGPWWICAALNEVPRHWDYLTERDDFRVLPEGVTQ
jgi:hypothetical protein